MSSAKADTDDTTVLDTAIRAEVLNDTLDILRTAAGEAILRIGKDGMDVALVDPANVYVHFIDIDAAAFESVPGGSFAVGTNLERLQDAIGKAEPHTSVTLAFNPETRRLNVRYENVDVDIAMIDPESIRNEPDKADVQLPNEFTLPTTAFTDAIDITDLVTDQAGFVVDADAEVLMLAGEGDTDNATVTFDSEDWIHGEINESVESWYGMDYLRSLKKSLQGDEVTFRVGEEFPLRVFYEFADGHADAETMLAPRIETE